MRIGLISDTHGLLRPEALAALRGCAHIVHAGDVGSAAVLDGLARLAPLTAVRGNNDHAPPAGALPLLADLHTAGVRLRVVHELPDLPRGPALAGVQVVVSGHSHRPAIDSAEGVLWVNPGSAGPRRFRLPVTLAWLEIVDGVPQARIVDLLAAP